MQLCVGGIDELACQLAVAVTWGLHAHMCYGSFVLMATRGRAPEPRLNIGTCSRHLS